MVLQTNGNNIVRYIYAGILTILIFGAYGWSTITFFSLNTKVDNHLHHIRIENKENFIGLNNKIEKLTEKVSFVCERLSTIEATIKK